MFSGFLREVILPNPGKTARAPVAPGAALLLLPVLLWLALSSPSRALEVDLTLFPDGAPYDGRAAASCHPWLPPQSLAVGSAGDTWMAGWADWGASVSGLLVHFDNSGAPAAWFTVPASQSSSYPYDGPRSLVVSRPSGGVYFGTRVFDPISRQVLVAAFDTDSRELWARRIPGTEARSALALGADSNGTYLLAGGSPTGQAPLLARVDSAGELLWAHPWSDEFALAQLLVDPEGVALVGGSRGGVPLVQAWKPEGGPAWSWQPTFAVEAGGSTTVLAAVEGGWSAAGVVCFDYPCVVWVARLDREGREIWMQVVDRPEFRGMRPQSLLAGASGELVIAGVVRFPGADGSGLLARLSPSGGVLWAVADPLPGSVEKFGYLAPEVDGGVVALASSGAAAPLGNSTLLRYDAAGALTWSRRLDPAVGRAEACGLAAAHDGTWRIASTVWDPVSFLAQPRDARLDAVASGGAVAWSAQEPGEAHPNETVASSDQRTGRGALCSLPDGGFVAAGDRYRGLASRTRWIARFRPDGSTDWSREISGTALAEGGQVELLAGRDGSLYLSTNASAPGAGPFTLARIGEAGETLWTWSTPAGAAPSHSPTWAVGPEGPIVAYEEPIESAFRSTLVWLSGSGAVLRSGQSVSPAPRLDHRVEVGPTGEVWIVGESDWTCFVEKWAADGSSSWIYRYSEPGGSASACFDLEADGAGGAAAVGEAGGRGLVLRLAESGDLLWQAASPPSPSQGGTLHFVDLGANGEVQAGGVVSATQGHPLLARFDRDGSELWTIAGASAGAGQMVWAVDRTPLGVFALFRASDGLEATLAGRLFDGATGTLLDELSLGDIAASSNAAAVGRDVTADGKVVVAATTVRASYDAVLFRLRGLGDLFASGFEGGDSLRVGRLDRRRLVVDQRLARRQADALGERGEAAFDEGVEAPLGEGALVVALARRAADEDLDRVVDSLDRPDREAPRGDRRDDVAGGASGAGRWRRAGSRPGRR